MKVLLWMVTGADRIPGGHEVQLAQTAKHLELLGVECVISNLESTGLAGFDLVHGFGLSPALIRRAREARVPVLLSTIFCGRQFILGTHIPSGRAKEAVWRLRTGLGLLRSSLLESHTEKCETILAKIVQTKIAYEMADMLLPNSEMEAAAVKRDLGVTTPYYIVPNGVDDSCFHPLHADNAPRARDFALYAGRFEPHKNQLGLINAMRNSNIPLVLVGAPHPHHLGYYNQCKKQIRSNMKILPAVPHDELPAIYRSAKVHVLPSWLETTGLVSLEAALCGCNIVTTDRGYAREYFADFAWYCDPADSSSIRHSVETAFQSPVKPELSKRILENFTWRRTAEATAKAYEETLRRAGGPVNRRTSGSC